MPIEIIQKTISLNRIKELAESGYGDMVKGVVDIKRQLMALGGELHADAEAMLLEDGSHQEDLWGFNIYPEKLKKEWIVCSSFINIRPRQGNRSMEIQDQALKEQIIKTVNALIQ